MLYLVLTAATALHWLAAPVTPDEYAGLVLQQVVRREPPSPETRAWYRAKGWVLACFLGKGMSKAEVRWVVGVRPDGWVREGPRYTVAAGEPVGVMSKVKRRTA